MHLASNFLHNKQREQLLQQYHVVHLAMKW